jgi:hypothetical protein
MPSSLTKPLATFSALGAVACHKYLPDAEGRLITAIEAGAAHPRSRVSFCPCNGNHVDPHLPAKGRGAPIRRGGRGRRDNDNTGFWFWK